jgi:hypothetical protein
MTQIKFADELLLQFDQLNSEFSDNAFSTGDLSIQTVDEYSHLFEHADILRALADATHIQYDSLRDRERVARAIPLKARQIYPLSFHQWRACMSRHSDPIQVAEWCVDQDKLPTVEEIRNHVGPDPEVPKWLKTWNKMQQLAEALVMYDDTPASVYEVAVQVGSIEWHPPYP